MSAAQLEGVAPARRADWRAQVEESKKDMGLLDELHAAAGGETRRRLFSGVLKHWNSLKTQPSISFDSLSRRTGT